MEIILKDAFHNKRKVIFNISVTMRILRSLKKLRCRGKKRKDSLSPKVLGKKKVLCNFLA